MQGTKGVVRAGNALQARRGRKKGPSQDASRTAAIGSVWGRRRACGLWDVYGGSRCGGERGGGTGSSNRQSTMRSVKVYDKEPTRARASLRLPASWQTQGASPNGNLGRIMIIAVRTLRLSFFAVAYCFSWPGSTRSRVARPWLKARVLRPCSRLGVFALFRIRTQSRTPTSGSPEGVLIDIYQTQQGNAYITDVAIETGMYSMLP